MKRTDERITNNFDLKYIIKAPVNFFLESLDANEPNELAEKLESRERDNFLHITMIELRGFQSVTIQIKNLPAATLNQRLSANSAGNIQLEVSLINW